MEFDTTISTYFSISYAGKILPCIECETKTFFSKSIDDALEFSYAIALMDAQIKYIAGVGDKEPYLGVYMIPKTNPCNTGRRIIYEPEYKIKLDSSSMKEQVLYLKN